MEVSAIDRFWQAARRDANLKKGRIGSGRATSDVPDRGARRMHFTALRLFSGLAGSYDLIVDWATMFQDRKWKVWVRERLPPAKGGFVLDIGCGTLLLEEGLSGDGRRFIGIDLSREMVSVGRSKRLPNVGLVVNGDTEFLPFPERAFDSVVGCYVAKYVDLERLAGELDRVTRPGAVVVLYDFTRPTGWRAPFVELYIQGGLRIAGALARLARRKVAFTFTELPSVIEGTKWDGALVPLMEGHGFETLATERLTGGVVFAYSGRRKETGRRS